MNSIQKRFIGILISKGDYEVLSKAYPIAAIIGSVGYIGFYFTDSALGMYENLYLRLFVATLFFQIFFLSKKLTSFSKLFIESIFAICLPLFYSFFFFATDQSLNWQMGYIFCGFTYGTLTGRFTNVFTVYPLFSISGFFLYDIFMKKSNMNYFLQGMDVLLASNISAIISSVIKLFINSFLMATIKLDHQQKELASQLKLQTKVEINEQLKDDLNKAKRLTVVANLSDSLSKDFTNLIKVITTQVMLLGEKYCTDNDKQKRIHTVLDVAEKSSSLIRQLSIFTQNCSLELVPVDIHAILTDTVNIIKKTLQSSNHIFLDFTAQDFIVFGDITLLQNSFYNIMLNGIQAMPDGGCLKICSKNIESKETEMNPNLFSKLILIEISDSGTGMDESIKERIFEPFFTTKETGKGVGMGLSMVYGTIRQHGGFIEVESSPGIGSTFSIKLNCIENKSFSTINNQSSVNSQ